MGNGNWAEANWGSKIRTLSRSGPWFLSPARNLKGAAAQDCTSRPHVENLLKKKRVA